MSPRRQSCRPEACALYADALTQITNATLREVDAEGTQLRQVLTEALTAFRATHHISRQGLIVGLHRFVTDTEAAIMSRTSGRRECGL